jgi:hypothetical protein
MEYKLVRVFNVQELYERHPDREFLTPSELTKGIMTPKQACHKQNKEKAKIYQELFLTKNTSNKKKRFERNYGKKDEFKK